MGVWDARCSTNLLSSSWALRTNISHLHCSDKIRLRDWVLVSRIPAKVVFVVQLLSPVWLLATTCTATSEVFLSLPISQSLPKLMSTESVILFNHLILCHPLLLLPRIFPRIRVFSNDCSTHLVAKVFGVSASASVLPRNIHGWFPLGLTSLISLLSNRLLRVISSTTIWKHQFSGTQSSLWSNSHIRTYNWKNYSFDYMSLVSKVTSLLLKTLSLL